MTLKHDVRELELDELDSSQKSGMPMFANNIELVKNLKVQLRVRMGESEMTIDELFNLKAGSLIKLNKEIDSPVELELEGKVVARGLVVAVDDYYGIKITDINQPQ